MSSEIEVMDDLCVRDGFLQDCYQSRGSNPNTSAIYPREKDLMTPTKKSAKGREIPSTDGLKPSETNLQQGEEGPVEGNGKKNPFERLLAYLW